MARILITSALPYINGVKHLGNLAGSMLPADVYARAMRLMGHEVLYVCATDEHGTPAELAARAADMDVRDYCDAMHTAQADAGAFFKLSYDYFGRTSNPSNTALTQHFSERLEANALIEERVSVQVYSNADGRFLPDRFVEGTCPNCGYEAARGDQCDNCGKLIDPAELINPYSTVSGSHDVELRETNHLYLQQSKMSDRLRTWVNSHADWPVLATSIANKWLDEGLRDRSITRDLSWGIPVVKDEKPRPGFENKVYYVWFDAPIGYIAATKDWADKSGGDWQSWWRTDKGAEDVRYVEFMGKDNVAFHTLSFPTTLMGSGEPWKLVDTLKAFNWLTWYGGKFSTSQKRGVFMDQASQIAPSDYWRWYLTANAPESADSAFTFEDFQARINSDLANVLGNFVNRITKYCTAKFDGKVPDSNVDGGAAEEALVSELSTRFPALLSHYEAMEFRKAANETRAIWAAGNEYLTEAAPWTHYKTDVEQAALGTRIGLNLAALFGVIAQPIIPDAAAQILDALNIPPQNRTWRFGDGSWDDKVRSALDALPHGHQISVPDVLFTKIEDADVQSWSDEFGGAESGA